MTLKLGSLKLNHIYRLIGTCLFIFSYQALSEKTYQWSESELALLKMNWLGSLTTLPPDPSNKYADNENAAQLGHEIFFDQRFSKNREVSCASCHIQEKSFTDGLAKAVGIGETQRSTPSLIGIAHSPWFFWDGRSDSLWSQALSPLESSVEHGGNRLQYARILYNDSNYNSKYTNIFGSLPDLSDTNRFPKTKDINELQKSDKEVITQVFVNIGKALAAYQRTLMPSPSRYDKYVAEVLISGTSEELSNDEISGLKLFIGKAMCITCHQGPLFTNHAFHNVGAPDPASKKSIIPLLDLLSSKKIFDVGRYKGVKLAIKSEFNCLGKYSDATKDECPELKFANTSHTATLGTFKVPTLRNIADTAPYFQLGQFNTLEEVLQHYNNAPDSPVGHSELTPLDLNRKELNQLESFLYSLSSNGQ